MGLPYVDAIEDRYTVYDFLRKLDLGRITLDVEENIKSSDSEDLPEDFVEDVWDTDAMSTYIEAILCFFPLQPLLLHRGANGTLRVIDGRKRVHVLEAFRSGTFRLQGLTICPELNGRYFEDLEEHFRAHFEDTTLNVQILRPSVPQHLADAIVRYNNR